MTEASLNGLPGLPRRRLHLLIDCENVLEPLTLESGDL